LADQETLDRLSEASKLYNKKVYVPCGAFWGASDISKMARKNSLSGLKVSMRKHPESLKLEGSLKEKLDRSLPLTSALVLYEGPVRDLCHLAPNNVNTMAVGALAALNLGFDKTQACLVADPA
jgi:aspartate dehydrogenase